MSILQKPLFIIMLAVLAVYGASIQNGYVYDDICGIVQNRDMDQPLGRWLFTPEYFEVSREISYRPVVTLTHWFDRRWGPAGGHILNLCLHAAVGMMLFVVGRVLLEPRAALWGSVLFLVHPAYSEAVYAITYREDLLCAFFLLTTLWGLHHRRFVWAVPAFVLALFSKESAMMLPVFVACLAFLTPFRRMAGWIPALLAIDAGYAAVRFIFLPSLPAVVHRPYPWIEEQGAVLFGYLRLLIFPRVLSVDHRIIDPSRWVIAIGLAALAALWIFTLVKWNRRSLLSIAGWWAALFLLPVMDIAPMACPSAERFLYIPMLLPALAAGAWLDGVIRYADERKTPFWLRPELWAALIVLVLATRTFFRGGDFRHNHRLLVRELQVNPRSVGAEWILAQVAMDAGRLEEARYRLQRVQELEPMWNALYIQMGKLERREGNMAQAERWFDVAAAAVPNDPEVIICMAEMKEAAGDTAAAEVLYRRAATLPIHPTGMNQGFIDRYRAVRARVASGLATD